MTVQTKEFDLLIEVYKHMRAEGSRPEFATTVQDPYRSTSRSS